MKDDDCEGGLITARRGLSVSRVAVIALRFACHSSVKMTSLPATYLIFFSHVAAQTLRITGISVFHGYMLSNHGSDI